eukprot:5332628-Pyramimonas_sp.AAC.1
MFRGRCRLRPGAHGPVLLVRVPEAALDGPAGGRAPARAGCHLRRPGRHLGQRQGAPPRGGSRGPPGDRGFRIEARE